MARCYRHIVCALVAGISFLPASATALGLGPLQLHSALGQPLKADVELLDVQSSDLHNLKVRLSIRSFQDTVDTRADNFSYHLVSRNGHHFIQLVSTVPIREPMLDFMIDVQWPRGELKRELAIFLDPPNSVVDSSVRRAGHAKPSLAQSSAATRHSPTPKTERYTVRRGDTLWAIARRFRRHGVGIHQLMKAIHRANPDAFANSRLNSLLAGATLRIPLTDTGSSVAQSAPSNKSAAAEPRGSAMRPQVRLLPADTTAAAVATALLPGSSGGPPNGYVLNVAALGDPGAQFRVAQGESGHQILMARGPATARPPPRSPLSDMSSTKLDREQPANTTRTALASPPADGRPTLEAMTATTADKPSKQPSPPGAASTAPKQAAASSESAAPPAPPLSLHVADQAAAASGFDLVGLLIDLQRDPVGALRRFWLRPLVAPVTGGLLVVLLIAMMVWHRRRQTRARMSADQLAQMLADDTAVPGDAPGMPVSLPPSPIEVRHSRLERVDFLLAAGSFREAESLVRLALAEEPENAELGVKLLTVYYRANDRDRFVRVARVFRERLQGGDHADHYWQRVCQMGIEICPDEPLFGGNPETESSARPPTLAATVEPLQPPVSTDEAAVPPAATAQVIDFPAHQHGAGAQAVVAERASDSAQQDADLLRELRAAGAAGWRQPITDRSDHPANVGPTYRRETSVPDTQQFRALIRGDSEALLQAVGVTELLELKLELARASIDTHDAERARELLQQVLAQAPNAQQQQARQMLRQL